jgi:two-component system sensor histidine kinase PilS (NtrC family)
MPHRLALSVPEEPALARVDTTHLWQVLDNLCDNAERHGRPRDGQLQLRLELTPAAHHGWQIHVCDNGPRIASADRGALFEPFFTTHSQGTGLGLFVSRELALANRGELVLEEPDAHRAAGNCFRLCLPAADEATATATTQARE